MNRSIILAAIMISVAILLNGYLERSARRPHAGQASEKQSPVVREKSIAVLPFQDLSASGRNADLADGVHDEILNDLSKLAGLKVISRTSVLPFKGGPGRNLREIGRQLGVANILEGSVQREDNNRVRVNVQLVDARTDNHLWAETYDREAADVFAVEKEIAKSIADQLGPILSH